MNERWKKIVGHPMVAKIINRETIVYGIAGVLTTGINFISYEGLYQITASNLTANLLAWIVAVSFAYLMNKWQVFQSRSSSVGEEISKVGKFFGARLVTLGIEQATIYIFIEKLAMDRWIVKCSLAVIVIVVNYVFSKLFIFQNETKSR